MHDKLFCEIELLSDKYLDVLEDICNIESPTSYKEGVDAVCEYCAKIAKTNGWSTEVFEQTVSGNTLLITMNREAKKAPMVLSAHMDTVHPVGSFGYPAVRRDDENMYGPGVMDCKGGIAAAFLAMEALKNCGFDSRPIKLYLQSDEENSSVTSNKETVRKMCEISAGAEGFLNLEGHVSDTAVLVRKGIVRYSFTVHGRALHSARCAYGANAIAEAAHKILVLEKMKDVDGLTCNCGVINGGDAPNSVAELCRFTADIRFVDEKQLEEAKTIITELSSTNIINGCTTEVEEISFRPAMYPCSRNYDFLDMINKIYQKTALPILEPRVCVSGSDAAYITEAGIPCVDNLGTEGGNIHTVLEFVKLSSLASSAKRIAAVALYI